MEFVELLKEAELLDFGQNFNIARPVSYTHLRAHET